MYTTFVLSYHSCSDKNGDYSKQWIWVW